MKKKHLTNSLQLYELSYVTERYPIDSLTDSTVMYLIGVLHEMLGNRERAVLYLSRLVSDKSIKASGSKVYQDAREEFGRY